MKSNNLNTSRKAFPSVSIIIPVHKKYPHFKEDEEKMKSLLKQTETTLLKDYPSTKTKPLIQDLFRLAEKIDYRNLEDGIGLFVSPYRERIVHFPFPVKEKVIIDRTFEMRDLYFAARNNVNYYVLAISEKKVRLLSGYNHTLTEEANEDMPYNRDDVGGKGRSRSGKFTSFSHTKNVEDKKAYNENKMEKFLREIDRVILRDKKLKETELIICGSEKIIGHFKRITKNHDHIEGYVSGNFDLLNEKTVYSKISAIIENKFKRIRNDAMEKLDDALNKKKAVAGIRDVWKAATNKEGRLLLVEKDFSCSAKTGKRITELITDHLDSSDIRYMSDAVDVVIGLVLKSGGEVVFMENGQLEDQSRIALITYY